MIKKQRPSFFYQINARPVRKFSGSKVYVSTGDSGDMDNGDLVTYFNRPSRANVEPYLNDILFAKMADTDKTFLVDKPMEEKIFSTGFFDISSNRIYPQFLYYLVKSDEFDGYKNAYSEGTTQISINEKKLKKICVSYEVDYGKQKKIADFLNNKINRINLLISKLESSIKLLNDLKTSKINDVISRSKQNALSIDLKYFSYISGRIGWQGLKSDEFTDKGPFLITGTDFLDDGTINYQTVVHISNKRYHEASNIQVKENDVLITKDGTVGKVAFINKLFGPTSLNSGVMLIRTKTNICFPKFLYYYLKSSYFWSWFKNTSREASTIIHLYQHQFMNFQIILPSLETQIKITDYLDKYIMELSDLIREKSSRIDELNKLKKSLIYEYVSGKKEAPEK